MSFCGDDHCITCSDEGIPMRVLKLDPAREVALCQDEGGNRSTVETALVETVAPGDELLVHAGVALIRLEPAR
jgi:hydrogenase expression/formation protein HypC